MKNIYFLSDFHLGARTLKNSLENEKKIVRWLDSVKGDAKAIYLLGDIVDFWFEYKTTVPRGFTRFFGKIAELTDSGIEVHWFTGNHDIWIFDYLPNEIGVQVHRKWEICEIEGARFFLAHGDNLDGRSRTFRFIRAIFNNRFCQRLFSALHPRWGIGFALWWSSHSRANASYPDSFMGEENEYLVQFAKGELERQHIDYFIFGHRHIMLDLMLRKNSRILILGDWIRYYSYAVFDGKEMRLDQFEPEE